MGGAKKEEEEVGPRSLAVKRSKSWCTETDRKLSVLVQRVCVLVTSEGWRVRMGMVGWAHTLLTHSHRYVCVCVCVCVCVITCLNTLEEPLCASWA